MVQLNKGRILNIFYEEPDDDRWLPFDRYPRRVVRQIVRGKTRPGGQTRVFLNLCAGLDQIDVGYRVNDYRFAREIPMSWSALWVGPACLTRSNGKIRYCSVRQFIPIRSMISLFSSDFRLRKHLFQAYG